MTSTRKTRGREDPALCEAAAAGDLEAVERLLATGSDPNSVDADGTTALTLAAAAGQVESAGRLLAAGADPDEQEASGLTALMSAVIANGELDLGSGHPVFLQLVELLIDAGAELDLEDENGDTALDHARSYDLEEMVELLDRP